MSEFTITIVGTGVIGTSLGLALKQQADPPRLIGHDKDLTIAQQGVKLGAFDKAEWNLVNACEPADLIVLALPLNGVRPTLEAIAPYLKPGAVITDTGLSKQAVLNWATQILPDTAHFVGGNPLVHPTGSGPQHATATLFQDKQYCLTPAANANEEAVQLVAGLVSLVGAVPYFLDAAEHDSLIVSVEQLPALLGVALVRALSAGGSWREIRKLAGGRFEQTTTGAEGDP
ncbi:MAG: prephenate dehydrogenase/arogenate dehydrogenase family protein, partial [Chloroflexi bacterium]